MEPICRNFEEKIILPKRDEQKVVYKPSDGDNIWSPFYDEDCEKNEYSPPDDSRIRKFETVVNPDAKCLDIFNLSEHERDIIEERIQNYNGLIRIFVHPYFTTDSRFTDRINTIVSAVLSGEGPATIIMEDYRQIESLYYKVRSALKNDVYVAPTFEDSGEPYPDNDSVLREGESFHGSNWTKYIDLLKSLGVGKIIIGGIYISPGSRAMAESETPYIGCMGKAFNNLKDFFEVQISNASSKTRKELIEDGAKQL